MQNIRGIVYFEGRDIEDVMEKIPPDYFSDAKIAYFDQLYRGEKTILPGILISGQIDDKSKTDKVFYALREEMGLPKQLTNVDLSDEADGDYLKPIKQGRLEGNYISIRIMPGYDLQEIDKLAKQIGEMTHAHDVYVRTVEPVDEEKPDERLVSIDIMIQDNYKDYQQQIEGLITDKGYRLGAYTMLTLKQ